MTQDDRPHRTADDKEEVYFHGSPSLRWEISHGWLWALLGIVIALAPILVKLLIAPNTTIVWWVYLVAIAIGLIFIFIPWIKSKSVRYRITNYRIDFERGLVSRAIDTIELWHVEDLKLRQSIVNRLLDVGTIVIFANDESNPQLYLTGIPHPSELFRTLEQRVIAVKRQRGVVKMDMPTTPPPAAG